MGPRRVVGVTADRDPVRIHGEFLQRGIEPPVETSSAAWEAEPDAPSEPEPELHVVKFRKRESPFGL